MLCCVCLLETHNIMDIFDEICKHLNIAEIVNKHLWFKPEPNDLIKSHICTICWHKINGFDQFYQVVKKTHKEYNKHIQDHVIKQEEDEEIFEHGPVQMEIDSVDKYENEKNPLECDQSDSKDFQVAKTECEDDKFDEIESENSLFGDEEEKTDELNQKTANKCHTVRKRIKQKETTNKPKKKKIEDSKMQIKRLDPILTEEMIRKHVPMGCDLCVFVGETFADIVKHFKESHSNIRAYITCCDKKFTKRYYVAQHAMRHENPNSFRCEECKKSFKTVGNLHKHNLQSHTPEEECNFTCESCPMKFATKLLLQLHQPSHIPREKWEFFCTKCPKEKTFPSKRLLNIHDINTHKTASNICNVCAKEIKNKQLFEKHLRAHYETNRPRIKCPRDNCDTWLKDEDNLKKHIRDTHNIENKLYKCPECGKECSNKKNLYGHRAYAHSNEVFKCEQCDKTFKKAISLSEHMAQHTGEILYSCPFCSRTFNSNSNMHNHKKHQHPIEWEEARRKKGVSSS